MKRGAQTRSNAWLKRHGTQVWKPAIRQAGKPALQGFAMVCRFHYEISGLGCCFRRTFRQFLLLRLEPFFLPAFHLLDVLGHRDSYVEAKSWKPNLNKDVASFAEEMRALHGCRAQADAKI